MATAQLDLDLLAQIFEHTPLGIAIFDTQMNYLAANRQWREDYNLVQEEIIGKNHYELAPDVPQKWREIHQRGLQGETLEADADPITYPNGKTDYIRWKMQPWYKSKRKVGGIILYATVVTRQVEAIQQHQLADAALHEQQRFLRQVIDLNPNLIFAKDYDGRFTLANKALADVYGTTHEYLIGKRDIDFDPHAHEVDAFLEADREVMRSGKVLFIKEETITSPSGETRWLQTTKVPIFDPDGTCNQVLGVSVDITARKQAEDALREQQRFLRQIIDLNPNLIFAKDYNGRFTLANKALAQFYNVTSEDLIGKTDADFNPNSQEVQAYLEADRQVMHTGKAVSVPEESITLASGETRWLQTTKVPLFNQNGIPTQVLGVAVDITDRKNAEIERERLIQELRVANRLAQENVRLKSEFLATMSHELRTPLNAIEGFTSIMLGHMGIELDPRARSMLERVSANSRRLLHLINDFLDLSRIESGRLELAHQPISPRELAAKWQGAISILAEEKHLGFDVFVDPAIPEVIYGDEEAISKVALNLLSNAIKFTQEGKVSLSLLRQADEWSIVVADTGIGIPPHAREFIFDEFRQVDQSSKRLYGGTGLGLAIVQKMTRAMGGTVTLKSEVGRGSTFTVTLPMVLVPEQV